VNGKTSGPKLVRVSVGNVRGGDNYFRALNIPSFAFLCALCDFAVKTD